MPSLRVTLLIFAFWLVCTAWMVRREYLPQWLATDAAPEFNIDLADEAAPRYTTWNILRDGKKLGILSTKLQFLPEENAYELESRFQNLEFALTVPLIGTKLDAKAPNIRTRSILGKDGVLRSLNTTAKFEVLFAQSKSALGFDKLSFEAELNGTVVGGQFRGSSDIRSPFGNFHGDLEPFAVSRGNLFNPMQPQDRIMGLTPGRSWRVTVVDPVSETVTRATLQSLGKMAAEAGGKTPDLQNLFSQNSKEFIAQVLDDLRDLEWKGRTESCRIIEYRGDNLAGRTWVRAWDGKVLRQEASGLGEKLVLVRDN